MEVSLNLIVFKKWKFISNNSIEKCIQKSNRLGILFKVEYGKKCILRKKISFQITGDITKVTEFIEYLKEEGFKSSSI